MLDLTSPETISYVANIIFVTWGIAAIINESRGKKYEANYFSAAYEMAEGLAVSLTGKSTKAQAENLVSFLKAAARNRTNRKFDIVGEEIRNPFQGQSTRTAKSSIKRRKIRK